MNSRQQHRDERQFHKPEVLSPAGSPEAFRAAVYAGADAVYVGGMQFGARAFASNLSEEELKEAIDFAHIYGVKVYLTINTLLKKKEIEEQLFSYLLPFYTCGLDAVIVQDIGVFAMVQQWFPDLDIHISTQMGVVSAKGAQLLLQLGAQNNSNRWFGGGVFCPRSIVLLLFGTMFFEQPDWRAEWQSWTLCPAVSITL